MGGRSERVCKFNIMRLGVRWGQGNLKHLELATLIRKQRKGEHSSNSVMGREISCLEFPAKTRQDMLSCPVLSQKFEIVESLVSNLHFRKHLSLVLSRHASFLSCFVLNLFLVSTYCLVLSCFGQILSRPIRWIRNIKKAKFLAPKPLKNAKIGQNWPNYCYLCPTISP